MDRQINGRTDISIYTVASLSKIGLELNNIPKVILKNIFTLSVIYPSLSTRAYNNRLKKRVIHIYLTATVNAFPAVTAAILTVG